MKSFEHLRDVLVKNNVEFPLAMEEYITKYPNVGEFKETFTEEFMPEMNISDDDVKDEILNAVYLTLGTDMSDDQAVGSIDELRSLSTLKDFRL